MKTFWFKLKQTLTSKTFWGVIILVLINVIPTIQNHLPEQWMIALNSFVAFLTVLAKIFPSKDYSASPEASSQETTVSQ